SAASWSASMTAKPGQSTECARLSASTTRLRSWPITCGRPSRDWRRSTFAGTTDRTERSTPPMSSRGSPPPPRTRGWSGETGATKKLEAVYEVPFLAHATMEPMNCTVRLSPDRCEIWTGTQVITRAQGGAARVTGLPLDKVEVHNHYLGGGFGRRLEYDFVLQ